MDLSEQFEALYGMLATYSEYEVGERICYRCGDEAIRSGTIMWIVAPDRVAEQRVPTRYVVKCDADSGLPDTVWQRDILEVLYRYVLKPVVDIVIGDSIYLWGDNCEVVKVDEPGLYGITLEVYYNGELREVWYRLEGIVYVCIRSF
jgi:hypothetical protein